RSERSRNHFIAASCRLCAVPGRTVEIIREDIRECSVCRTQLLQGCRLFNCRSHQRMAKAEAIRTEDAKAGIDDSIPVAHGQRGPSNLLRRLEQFSWFPILQRSDEKECPRVGIEFVQPRSECSFESRRQRERSWQ